jgi:hypothetical protein
MAPDTEAEFRCSRVVALRKSDDFHIEPERDAARLGLTLSEVCQISHSQRPYPDAQEQGAAARRMMPGDLTDALE